MPADDPGQILHRDVAVNKAQNQRVGNRDRRALGGGEDAAEDTADDDDDHQQAGDAVPERLQNELGRIVFGAGVAPLLCHDACHDHAGETPQNPGDIARHEQRGNGNGTGHRRIDDHDVARGDHHARRTRGNVADRDVFIGIALFLLQRSENTAHGHRRGNAGARHGAEEHVRDDVGLGQRAGQTVRHQLGTADKPAGDAARVHQVAGQDKEGNRQQGEGVHALEHLLRRYDQRVLPGHDDVQRHGRAHPDAQADGEADGQRNKDEHNHDRSGQCNRCHTSTSRQAVPPRGSPVSRLPC